MYAVRIACAIPNATVHVAEPVPSNADRIEENATLNNVSGRIKLIRMALSNREGEVNITLREDFERGSNTGNASVAISDDADGQFEMIKVRAACFDAVQQTQAINDVHVMKIDIEGHEDLFFEGARDWLLSMKPFIFTEINQWYYEKRGTTAGVAFRRTLPSDYNAYLMRRDDKQIIFSHIVDIDNLKGMKNALLAPDAMLQDVCNISPHLLKAI